MPVEAEWFVPDIEARTAHHSIRHCALLRFTSFAAYECQSVAARSDLVHRQDVAWMQQHAATQPVAQDHRG